MKKLLISLLIALSCAACIEQLYAQSFPLSVKVQWDPNPTSDNVTNYIVVFNGGAPVTIASSACTATLCEVPGFVVPAAGSYTAQVTAVNYWGSSASTTISVQVSVPGKSSNVKITK